MELYLTKKRIDSNYLNFSFQSDEGNKKKIHKGNEKKGNKKKIHNAEVSSGIKDKIKRLRDRITLTFYITHPYFTLLTLILHYSHLFYITHTYYSTIHEYHNEIEIQNHQQNN